MSRFFLTLLSLFSMAIATAQIHEIGVFVGGSNLVGDVGNDKYIYPNEAAFGAIYKWNVNPRYSWRISYTQSKITGDDANSSDLRRQARGLRFQNNVKEVAIGFEFNFNEFNLHSFDRQTTPYVVASVSYVQYDGLFFPTNIAKYDSSHGTVGIPMIVGVKHNILPHFIIAAEVGARYTFADDIDGSNPTNSSIKQLRFGNINSKDWFVFSGITLTYTFGNKPCYCSN